MPRETLLNSKPDFVLEVFQTIDQATGKPTVEAQADLERLLKVLDLKRFYIEIRPGTLKSLLVFIKLGDDDLLKAVEDDKTNDWVYGVNNDLLTTGLQLEGLSIAEKLRIIYQILITPSKFGGCGITPTVANWNFVRSIIPVSNYEILKNKFALIKSENSAFNDAGNQANIDFVLENFGTKYAFYHYFLNTYIGWLLPFAVIGFLSNLILLRYSLVFTGINLTWSVAFYLYWKLSQLKLAKKWGVSKNVEGLEPPRSEQIDEPTYKRLIRELSFIPTSLVFIGWLVACQLFCFSVEIFLNEIYDGPLRPYLSLVPTILLSLMVPVVTLVYNKFVTKSLDWENHSKNSTFNYSKVIKAFIFNFLTSYMALFITSFLYLPFGFKLNSFLPVIDQKLTSFVNITVKRDNFAINEQRLNSQYQYFILINQVVGLLLEFVVPYVLPKVLAHPSVKGLLGKNDEIVPKYQDSAEEQEFLTDIRNMLELPEYDVDDDYRQLILQFGFLVLFGPVWSLGPFISLVINLIQQKLDLIKLFAMVKTPVPARANSIFPWDDFLKLLVWLGSVSSITVAIMYNSDIVSSSSRSAVGIRWWKIVGPALVFEHVVFLVIKVGEKLIDYYVDYIERKTPTVDDELDVRKKYLSTVYNKSTIVGGAGSVNNIESLLTVSSLVPQQLVQAKTAVSSMEKKKSVEKDLSKIDKKIEVAANEKLKLDDLYEEKNNKVKEAEAAHVQKLSELAAASTEVDKHSQALINEKNQIIDEFEVESSRKLSELEQLKQEKLRLEQLKQQKLSNIPAGLANGVATTSAPEVNGAKNVHTFSATKENGSSAPITEKLKEYIPEQVVTAATSAVVGATATATALAATAQSKIVDLQGKATGKDATDNVNGNDLLPESTVNNFDLQDGDRVINSSSKINGEVVPVISTIDGNDHFNPDELEETVEEKVNGGEHLQTQVPETATAAATATAPVNGTAENHVTGTPTKVPKTKKSKSPLKGLFKKK